MSNLTFKQIQDQVEAWIVDVNEEIFNGMLSRTERMQLERDLEKLERISGELHVMNMHSRAFFDRIARRF